MNITKQTKIERIFNFFFCIQSIFFSLGAKGANRIMIIKQDMINKIANRLLLKIFIWQENITNKNMVKEIKEQSFLVDACDPPEKLRRADIVIMKTREYVSLCNREPNTKNIILKKE